MQISSSDINHVDLFVKKSLYTAPATASVHGEAWAKH